jgi:quercetin dioxygenase-like cupin family protein
MSGGAVTERDAAVPQLLCEVQDLLGPEVAVDAVDAGGTLWKLAEADRQLDANVVRLRAGHPVRAHDGPDQDVLMLVLAGSGSVTTRDAEVAVRPGSLLWLPRRSRRAIEPGADGLTYLTVHPRRPKLQVGLRPG